MRVYIVSNILHNQMKILGVDPSIRSTGLCLIENDKMPEYAIICSHPTKRMLSLQLPYLRVLKYDPDEIPIGASSITKECVKMDNIMKIIGNYTGLLDEWRPDVVHIESIAMSACGRIDALSMLNGIMRYEALKRGIPVRAIPPTSVKLQYSGNGAARKEQMIMCWEACDNRFSGVKVKIDDIADAHAIASFPPDIT